MELMSWRIRLEEGLRAVDEDPTGRFAQLATVTADGEPRIRTVVVRALTPDAALLMVTDARSQKVAELRHQPQGALCWYLKAPRRQFRFRGPVTFIDAPDARRATQWASLSERVRAQFIWPEPGTPRAPASEFEVAALSAPPPNFGLLSLQPTFVDYLDLSSLPHLRVHHRRDAAGRWHALAVNP
jgi:PPOX class probable FMN-dependent enzyme